MRPYEGPRLLMRTTIGVPVSRGCRQKRRALGSLAAGLRIPTHAWWCGLRLCQFSISFSKPRRQGNRLDRWKLAGSVQSWRLVPG